VKILESKAAVDSPVSLVKDSGNYLREFDTGYKIGNLPMNKGGKPTNVMTILTDVEGNLVNTFSVPLRYGGQ